MNSKYHSFYKLLSNLVCCSFISTMFFRCSIWTTFEFVFNVLSKLLFLQASSKFRWGTRVVIVLGRVLKALIISSAHKTPETATQRSFRTLREDSEVKEILFNKSLYQRGKSVRFQLVFWNLKIKIGNLLHWDYFQTNFWTRISCRFRDVWVLQVD